MSNTLKRVNEDDLVTCKIFLDESTEGETLSVRYRVDGGTGTGTEIASVSGAAAFTEISFSIDFTGIAPNDYLIEIWSDFDGVGKRPVFPSAETEKYIIRVVDRYGS